MSNAKRRRHFTGQEKVAILRRHLVDHVPVPDLCEEHGIHPTLFYRWQENRRTGDSHLFFVL
ncbi:MAG: transposase [Planctomycetota bacterium]